MKRKASSLSRAIVFARKTSGLSIEECAKRANISKATLVAAEKDSESITVKSINKIARVFDLEAQDLYNLSSILSDKEDENYKLKIKLLKLAIPELTC